MNLYEPTAADIAVCKALDELRGTTRYHRAVRSHVDTIETPAPDDDDEMRAARQWVLDQDDAGNSAPFIALQEWRYVFGDTGYTGALAYLVDIVQYRRTEKARNAEMLRMYRAAHQGGGMNTQKESDVLVRIDELMDMIDYHISNCTEDDTITEIKRLAQNVWDAVTASAKFHYDGQLADLTDTEENER